MIEEKLNYEDLKLGEKSVEFYKAGNSLDDIQKNSAIYLNTQPFFDCLNVTDAVIANVLMGGNCLLTGRFGCGKSQLASDFAFYYFGGSIDNGGHSFIVQGDTNLDIIQDVFTKLDKDFLKRVFNHRINAHYINIEEINRTPPIKQNEFFAGLNGRVIYGGEEKQIGGGFCPTISTANLGNGEYKGTFDSDSSMLNRFGIVINLDEPEFKPTFEDKEYLSKIRPADSRIKKSPTRDITAKIIEANNQIRKSSIDLGFSTEGVLKFIRESLDNCSKSPMFLKDLEWAVQNPICQKCGMNKKSPSEFALCSMVQSPVPRTLENTRLYATALDYLLKLKGKKDIDPVDLVFKAFELTGPYQGTLNPFIVSSQKFNNKNSSLMKEVIKKLKEDYRKNEDRILTSLNMSKQGKNFLFYFTPKKEGSEATLSSGFDKLSNEEINTLKSSGTIDTDPFEFHDKGGLGYSWVQKAIDFNLEEFNRSNSKSKNNKNNKEK